MRHKTVEKLKRIDYSDDIRKKILPLCRLKYGEIWKDKINGHKIGVLSATIETEVKKIMGDKKAKLLINDPPYNIIVGRTNTKNLFKIKLDKYLDFSKKWVNNSINSMDENSHLYIWLGCDYNDNFQPLPDFMIMMREFNKLKPRNFITLRNQRGYGTQKNWMWVRQELLHYTLGNPEFNVVYTNIPKVLKGYYKAIGGEIFDNLARSKSGTIRPGNVWLDIQQVFYRTEENVSGCYAQKPLKAIERIILSSSKENDIIVDFFAHSGTTLIAGEKLKRTVYSIDTDPIYAEISIRRLENYRKTGKTGWQWNSPFPEIIEINTKNDKIDKHKIKQLNIFNFS